MEKFAPNIANIVTDVARSELYYVNIVVDALKILMLHWQIAS